MALDNPRAAVAAYTSALEADPASSTAVLEKRAQLWYALHEFGPALQDYEQVV